MDNKGFDRDEGNVVNNNKQMQVRGPVRPETERQYQSHTKGLDPSKYFQQEMNHLRFSKLD